METILFVEDEQLLRSVLVTELQNRGYDVLEAEDGDSGIESALLHQPDLIISDINMDGPNGFMLFETLRQDTRTSEIPFILISGYAGRAGAWESEPDVIYLSKPFRLDELLTAIESQLSKKAEQKEDHSS